MLPNLVIIGAMKGGTTSLYEYLRTHPSVGMTTPKELDFFNQNWELGRSWYEAHFEQGTDAVVIGEASANYTKAHLWPETAQRMHSLIPDARLVYVLRDPVERMRSQYQHHVAAGIETRPLEAALSGESDQNSRDYLETSRYAFQLEQYLQHFSCDQVLAIGSVSLRHRRRETLRTVFRFLGVDEHWVPPNMDFLAHQTSKKVLVHPFAQRVRELPGYRALADRTPLRLKQVAHRIGTKPVEIPKIPSDLRRQLWMRLKPDVEQLRRLVDLPDIDTWGP